MTKNLKHRAVAAMAVILFSMLLLTEAAHAQRALWGMTSAGGANNVGVIFKTNLDGSGYAVQYNFVRESRSSRPASPLAKLPNGRIIGTSTDGGVNAAGDIFEVDPVTGTMRTIYSFTSATGSTPRASVMMASNGKLYGTTANGGTGGLGVVYSFDLATSVYTKVAEMPAGLAFINGPFVEINGKLYAISSNDPGAILEVDYTTNEATKKIDFGGPLGTTPHGSLLLTSSGKVYGATMGSDGSLFEYDPVNNIVTPLVQFPADGPLGFAPVGQLLEASNGLIYGLTYQGQNFGTLFEFDPATNTATPRADVGLLVGPVSLNGLAEGPDGWLYGAARSGGGNNSGASYKFNIATGDVIKLNDFQSSSGAIPVGWPVISNGKVFGVTAEPGIGTMYSYDLANPAVLTHVPMSFSPGGFAPSGDLVLASNGKFYGTAAGGVNNRGVIFEFDPTTQTYTKKADFTGFNGEAPQAGLLLASNGRLYGTTTSGGLTNVGVLFEYNPTTGILTKKVDFSGAQGASPEGKLIQAPNGRLYGVTRLGGFASGGTVFSYDIATNNLVSVVNFSGLVGSEPSGTLVEYQPGKLCGTTRFGGSAGSGTIFVFDTTTGVGQRATDFNSSTGVMPWGGLTLALNNRLYGMTSSGGTFGGGTIYEFNPATNVITKRVDLSASVGVFPKGKFVLSPNGNMIGLTSAGGALNAGTIIEFNPASGSISPRINFTPTNGTAPNGSLISTALPLKVTGFSPPSGIVGTSVTITGEQFNSVPSNNHVWFGATKGTVTGVTATTLIATVPTGTTWKNISVTTDGLSATTAKPYNVRFASSNSFDASTFLTARTTINTLANPSGMASGDFDGDGKPDIAVAMYNSNIVAVYRNLSVVGNSMFAAPLQLSTGNNPYTVTVADLNNDGKPDLVAGSVNSLSIRVYLNTSTTGTMSFAPGVNFAAGGTPYGIAAADIDGDNRLDLAIACFNTNSVSILRNATPSVPGAVASFADRIEILAGVGATDVIATDLNGDQKRDLVVSNFTASSISVITNKSLVGMIGFNPRMDFATLPNPLFIALGDLDGDGREDIAASSAGTLLALLRNNVAGGVINNQSFSSPIVLNTSAPTGRVQIGDLDGDGRLDLAAVPYTKTAPLTLFQNFGNGPLSAANFFRIEVSSNGAKHDDVLIADIDGDKRPDLTLTNTNLNQIYCYRSRIDLVQTITFQPLQPATYGDVITLGATASSGLAVSYQSSDVNVALIIGNTLTIVGPGTATITANQLGEPGLLQAVPVARQITATKKSLTVTAASKTKGYADPNPELTYTIEGFVAEEDEEDLDVPVNIATTATQFSIPGEYPITLSGGEDPNYEVTSTSATLTITGTIPDVYVTSPADGAVNLAPASVKVTAKSVTGATEYTIQLSTSPDFASIIAEMSGSTKTLTFTGLQYGTTYYSRVHTNMAPGFGTAKSFSTKTAESLSYVSSPVKDAINTATTLSVTANTVPGASEYTIEVSADSDFEGEVLSGNGAGKTYSFTGLAYGTTYYNRVKTNLGGYGEVRSFSTKTAESLSFVKTPAHEAINIATTVKITANTVPGAGEYTIQLSETDDFAEVAFEVSGTTPGLTFTGLDYNKRYFGRVKTNLGGFGQTRSFTTQMAESISFVKTPADEAVNIATTVKITANTVPGAGEYTIQLSETDDFAEVAFEVSGTTPGLTFTGLDYNKRYFDRVKTNLGGFGQTRSFTTQMAESISFVKTPANEAVNIATTVKITANTVPGASEYTIQLSEMGDFSEVAFEMTGATAGLSFTGLNYNTRYYNRVNTNLGGFGQVRSFTTKTAESISFVLSPANLAMNVNANATITANTVSGAGEYTIQLSETPGFEEIAFERSGPGKSQSFTGLRYNITYYNRVSTDLSPGSYGIVKSFTTRTAESISFVTYPLNNALNVNTSLSVKANTVPGATTYTIQLSTSQDFSDPEFTMSGAGQTKSFLGLAHNTPYYSRVSTDLGGFGEVRMFTTRTLESLAYVYSPASNATNVKVTLNITANTVPGAGAYTIQLSLTDDFADIAFERTGTSRTQAFAGLANGTTYFNRVGTDVTTGYGAIRSFTTVSAPAARIGSDLQEEELPAEAITARAWPNPFRDHLTIQLQATELPAAVSMTDMSGKVVFEVAEQTQPQLEVRRSFASGTYLLRVSSRNGSKVIKVVRVD